MEANLYGDKVIEMDEDMMNMIADAYAQAAYMAEFAGCDIVNIHGGHGWLISQFLSDLNNHRTDKYGGCIENKARFPLMIVDRIRQRCPNLIIEFRLSGEEDTEEASRLKKRWNLPNCWMERWILFMFPRRPSMIREPHPACSRPCSTPGAAM